MKKIKVRFKTNLSGHKAGDTAEVTEDFVRRAGGDVEVLKSEKESEAERKDVKVSNKVMPKEKVKTKTKSVK